MRTHKKVFLTLMLAFACITMNSQKLQFDRPVGFDGLNTFETKKNDTTTFEKIKVKVGGDFALQFQGLDHSNDLNNLVELTSNVNLPTANLNLDAQLAQGVRVHLRTYLSSRHHTESWVKGGYLQIDDLDFIKDGFASDIMDVVTIRVGQDQINYGDAHFRRSDNANAIYNPFVGNYIMDSFTTEPFVEVNISPNDWIAVVGLSNGNLNQSVIKQDDNKVTFYGKLGYDSQISEDLRVRLTGSFYNAGGYTNGNHLYSGDRAGARYYSVLDVEDGNANFRSGRFNPGFKNETAFQFNPFVKMKGLEFFGIYEVSSGNKTEGNEDGKFTQLGAEVLYRFGSWEQFYVGGRYNTVKGFGEYATGSPEPTTMKIDRSNIGFGWFMTKNILTKLEYVNQSYDENFAAQLTNANFKGVVLEAVISF